MINGNIGIIAETNDYARETALRCGLQAVIYTNNTALAESVSTAMLVSNSDGDISLHDSREQVVEDYIINICDIVYSEVDNIYYRKLAAQKNIPYIINNTIYHNDKAIAYSDGYISEYLSSLNNISINPTIDDAKQPFWAAAFGKFFLRYKKSANKAVVNELVVTNSTANEGSLPNSQDMADLNNLLDYYDNTASKYNAIYRSSLYLRALFPLLATICVAIAVNIKNFGNYMQPTAWWSILSSGLFFIQAVFNYLIIALSNYIIKRCVIEKFTNARYMAENLRMLLITCPNGIPRAVNNRLVLTDIEGNIARLNLEVSSIMRRYNAISVDYSSTRLAVIARELELLVGSQINYHAKTKHSYELCGKSINLWAKVFFFAGLCIVVGRGLYQSIAQFVSIDGAINGIKTADYITAIVNFLALAVPPITALFTGLAGSLNIDNNKVRSQMMELKLRDKLKVIEAMQEGEIIYSDLSQCIYNLSDLFTQETLDWHSATRQKKVSKM